MTITLEQIQNKIISNDELMGQVVLEIDKKDLELFQNYIAQSDTVELVDTQENEDTGSLVLYIY